MMRLFFHKTSWWRYSCHFIFNTTLSFPQYVCWPLFRTILGLASCFKIYWLIWRRWIEVTLGDFWDHLARVSFLEGPRLPQLFLVAAPGNYPTTLSSSGFWRTGLQLGPRGSRNTKCWTSMVHWLHQVDGVPWSPWGIVFIKPIQQGRYLG